MYSTSYQCFGSGSGRIRIIGPDPDADPLKETLIWILVPGPDPHQNDTDPKHC